MPYKDKEKAKEYFAQWQRSKYIGIRLSIRKDSKIPEALERMEEDLQIAPATYAQQALVVQLRKDGYLSE